MAKAISIVSQNKKRLFTGGVSASWILCACIGFGFAFIDTSAWLSEGNPFATLGYNRIFVANAHKYIVFAFITLLSTQAVLLGGVSRSSLYLSMGILAFALISALRSLAGTGDAAELVSTEIRQLITLAGIVILFGKREGRYYIYAFVTGATISAFLRVLLAPTLFFTGIYRGNIGGTETLATDSVFLYQLRCLALLCMVIIWASHMCRARQRFWRAIGVLFLTCFVLIGSYRRSDVVALIFNSFSFFLVIAWIRGRFLRTLPLISVVGAIVMALGFGLMVGLFGLQNTIDRLESLTLSQERGRFSNSNMSYMDDWVAFVDVMKQSNGMGVGFGMPYGVYRLTYELLTEGMAFREEVPLHIRSYEYIARMGILGLLFQLWIFAVVPIKCLFKVRRKWRLGGGRMGYQEVRAVGFAVMAIVFLIYEGFFPFGAPFAVLHIKSIVFIGIALGYLVDFSNRAVSVNRQDFYS